MEEVEIGQSSYGSLPIEIEGLVRLFELFGKLIIVSQKRLETPTSASTLRSATSATSRNRSTSSPKIETPVSRRIMSNLSSAHSTPSTGILKSKEGSISSSRTRKITEYEKRQEQQRLFEVPLLHLQKILENRFDIIQSRMPYIKFKNILESSLIINPTLLSQTGTASLDEYLKVDMKSRFENLPITLKDAFLVICNLTMLKFPGENNLRTSLKKLSQNYLFPYWSKTVRSAKVISTYFQMDLLNDADAMSLITSYSEALHRLYDYYSLKGEKMIQNAITTNQLCHLLCDSLVIPSVISEAQFENLLKAKRFAVLGGVISYSDFLELISRIANTISEDTSLVDKLSHLISLFSNLFEQIFNETSQSYMKTKQFITQFSETNAKQLVLTSQLEYDTIIGQTSIFESFHSTTNLLEDERFENNERSNSFHTSQASLFSLEQLFPALKPCASANELQSILGDCAPLFLNEYSGKLIHVYKLYSNANQGWVEYVQWEDFCKDFYFYRKLYYLFRSSGEITGFFGNVESMLKQLFVKICTVESNKSYLSLVGFIYSVYLLILIVKDISVEDYRKEDQLQLDKQLKEFENLKSCLAVYLHYLFGSNSCINTATEKLVYRKYCSVADQNSYISKPVYVPEKLVLKNKFQQKQITEQVEYILFYRRAKVAIIKNSSGPVIVNGVKIIAFHRIATVTIFDEENYALVGKILDESHSFIQFCHHLLHHEFDICLHSPEMVQESNYVIGFRIKSNTTLIGCVFDVGKGLGTFSWQLQPDQCKHKPFCFVFYFASIDEEENVDYVTIYNNFMQSNTVEEFRNSLFAHQFQLIPI